MEMTLGTTVIYLVSCSMSALIQSVSGFGFAIFMMSVIPNFMPYATSTVLSGLLSLGTNVANVTRYRKRINWKLIIVPAISYFIISYLVINFAAGSSDATLKKILGVDPLKITLLKCGTFESYERKYGSKIRTMNPEVCEINDLLICHRIDSIGKGDLLNDWI